MPLRRPATRCGVQDGQLTGTEVGKPAAKSQAAVAVEAEAELDQVARVHQVELRRSEFVTGAKKPFQA